MEMTLFEIKQALTTVGEQLKKNETEITQKAIDPSVSMDELKQLEASKESLQKRFDILKNQHDQVEAEQKASLSKNQFSQSEDPNQKIVDAKAELIRSTMRKEAVPKDASEMLIQSYDGNIFQALVDDTTTTGGAHFIPKNTGTTVIAEPVAKNPLRKLSTVTSIANLELPKVTFTIDDDDFIEDGETAKELKAKGSVVSFGRFKSKISTDLSETVIEGTNTNLVSTVEANLQGGVQYKEKSVAFATSPKTGQEHMSFYDKTEVKIKEVTGNTMLEAIVNAAADLEDVYSENAVVVMRKSDYFAMLLDLANGSTTLFGRQPEEIIGFPAEFCDKATTPVVGDYQYSHFNYDPKALYDQDKNVKTGMHSFVATTWFDHQIKLSSAFRLAKKA